MKTKGLLIVFIVLLAISFLPDLVIWLHQRFIFWSNPFVIPVFLFILLLVSIPFIIKLYRWLIRQSFAEDDKEPVLLFAMGGLCWMIVYWKLGDATIDLHYRDTMYVTSAFEVWKYISIIFGICCMIYFAFPVIFGRNLNIYLSRIHFWSTFIGLNILIATTADDIVSGQPRRYFEYAGVDSYKQIQLSNYFIFLVLILVVIAQLLFVFNIISSLFRKREMQ